MKDRPLTSSGQETTRPGAIGETTDLVDAAKIFRSREESRDDDGDEDDTARVPAITRMPDGIEVVETRTGRAVGQWVLQVRCQCGRRWFELEAIDATNCPRCGLLVYVDVQAPGR